MTVMNERMDWTDIARYFYLPDERLQAISRDFSADIDRALAGEAGATVSAENRMHPCREGMKRAYFWHWTLAGLMFEPRGFASWDDIVISSKKGIPTAESGR